MSFLAKLADERFLEHRRRSTSTAGMVGGVLAILLFGYHFYFDHRWSWDLFAIGVTIVGIKLLLMAFYYVTD